MRAAHAWVERRWPRTAHTILIEKSANGTEIIAELKRELTGIHAITTSTDKITRAIAASPPLESGNVLVPGRPAPGTAAGYQAADWVANLIEEAATFPNATNDDQVDAFSQAINWARERPTGYATTHVPQGRLPDNDSSKGRRQHPRPIPTLESLAAYLGLPITNGRHYGNLN